ncbi:MAG: L,D-transpeptidase family protein [Coriobacteriia bacterium]|nr:L,D-transpeptidase family protein [Coriobacteriia bacterium]
MEKDNELSEEAGKQPAAPARKTPSTAANRRREKDTAAQVEEWRLRQASRAVPASYRAEGGRPMPSQVYTPDADVLDAQNEIPPSGRPTRTRPSIPNYTPRKAAWEEAPSIDGVAESVADAEPVTVGVQVVEEPSAAQNAADVLRGSAAKAGEAGAALIGNLQQSEAAGKAKDFASSIPGKLSAAGKGAAAKLRDENGELRKKPIAIGAAVIAYLIIAIWFSFHYYPLTTIGQVNVGGMDVPAASKALGEAVDGYKLEVEGEGEVSFTVMGSEAGLSLDAEQIARQAKDADTGFLWPVFVFLPHDHSDIMLASADAAGFREKISDAVNWFNQEATAPRNATVAYNESEKKFEIVPEERGNTLDEEKITEHVIAALASMEPTLTLGDGDYQQPTVFKDDERLQTALGEAQKVLATNTTFTAHGSDVATLDGETAAKWVLTDENVQIALDEDQVNEWVQKLVDKISTVGTKRTWTREDGEKCTVSGGTYGWEADWLAVDEALHEAIETGSTNKVEVPMQQEAAVYNGKNKRDWKSYIDVDLDMQHATYYDDKGEVIWEADFVSGAPDGEHDTPQGVYYINNKESPSTLIGEANATGNPEYETKVSFWMAWRGNDVGFHDADWQDEFGGSRYEEGFGSHGCINLSPEDAESLYKLADINTVVVCHGSGATKEKKSSDEDESEASDEAEAAAEPAEEVVSEEEAWDEEADYGVEAEGEYSEAEE